jgi:hypothetical protein
MGGIMIATWAGVNTDPLTLLVSEVVEHAIV